MSACRAKTRNGKRCAAPAGKSGYCSFHDPALAAKRTAGRKLGGHQRVAPKVADPTSVPSQIRDVAGVMALLDAACKDTLAQENTSKRTRGLVQIAMTYLKALEVGELETRLEAIEEALKLRGANSP